MENLVQTASIEDAVAFVQAYIGGSQSTQLWIVGPPGCGKSFLASWARQQCDLERQTGILDNCLPDPDLPSWLSFCRDAPPSASEESIVQIGYPEYERKCGVLEEWGTSRGIVWEKAALTALLKVQTNNLQRLRSLAERTLMESGVTTNQIREIDVIRTLSRVGYLEEILSGGEQGTAETFH